MGGAMGQQQRSLAKFRYRCTNRVATQPRCQATMCYLAGQSSTLRLQ